MKILRKVLVVLGFIAVVGSPLSSEAAGTRMTVVATLSTFADLVKTIGDDHVEVSTIA